MNKKVLVWPDVLWIEVLCEDGHELGYAGVHVHKTRLKNSKKIVVKRHTKFTDDLQRCFKTKDPAQSDILSAWLWIRFSEKIEIRCVCKESDFTSIPWHSSKQLE